MITAWEGLDQAGLISEMLPGWERLRSMPQRDPIHLYTVDRHLMETAVNASGLDEERKRSFHARLGEEMGRYSSEPPRLSLK